MKEIITIIDNWRSVYCRKSDNRNRQIQDYDTSDNNIDIFKCKNQYIQILISLLHINNIIKHFIYLLHTNVLQIKCQSSFFTNEKYCFKVDLQYLKV